MTGGMLSGVRVVELASERAAFAGKLLADLGADVIVVEPPGGHLSRSYGPFVADTPDPERSLWWWHYNTSKRGVTIDLAVDGASFAALVATADIVLESEPSARVQSFEVDRDDYRVLHPDLIWVTMTPFGRGLPRSEEEAIDLTIQAAGGPVWSCGYDDHSLPPVRGGGNQGYQTASIWAVLGCLTALLHRDAGGTGQCVDVNMHAAANVTTEMGSYEWLVRRQTVQRQTGRHANVTPTSETMAMTKDGLQVTTGVPPRTAAQYQSLLDWLDDLGLREHFHDLIFLELGAKRDVFDLSLIGIDAEFTAIFAAGRDAVVLVASHLDAYDFFIQGQQHGLTCSVVNAPEDVLADPHFIARGFPVAVHHDDLGRDITYPGAPFVSNLTPYRVHRAPRIGEHNDEVLGPLRSPG